MSIFTKPVFCVLILHIVFCSIANAKVFQVDSLIDQTDLNVNDSFCLSAGNHCTLRAAIQQANALPGKDTIVVPAGLYLLNVDTSVSAIIDNEALSGDLDITESVEIIGALSPTVIDPANPPLETELTMIDG